MSPPIFIAGVGMVPFARPGFSKSYDAMAEVAVRAALADAGLDFDLVEHAFCAFALADSGSGQRALHRVGMTGIPIANVNNGCGSGSTALQLARLALLSGEAECALAVGFEEMHQGSLDRGFPYLTDPLEHYRRCVGDALGRGEQQLALPSALHLHAAQLEWMHAELGIADDTFAQVAVKARAHAARNPHAVFREPLSVRQILAQRPVFGRLRRFHACPPGSGAAAVVVTTPRFAERHGLRQDVVIRAHVTVSDMESDLDPPNVLDALGRQAIRRAARRAYELAGVGPEDIDVAEVHDCAVSNELMACAAVGFCREEDLSRFVQGGANTYGGKVVVGPSGGLLARGHPMGATGLAQVVELTGQLRGQAGARQVEGARTALQHNGSVGGGQTVAILQATRRVT